VAIAWIVVMLAFGSGVTALSGLVLAIIGVSRRHRWFVRSGVTLAACGALGFAAAGTLTLSTAVGRAGAANATPTPTTLDLRQWFRVATGATLPAGSDPITGLQQSSNSLAAYYLVIAPSPEFDRLLARDFTPTDRASAQRVFTPAPDLAAWRLVDGPEVRYFTRTYELPSRAVFVSYVAVDPVSRAVYFVGRQVSD
jgi:hypothetical protein